MMRSSVIAVCVLAAEACCAEPGMVDLVAIQSLSEQMASAILQEDWPMAKKLVQSYISSPEFNAHIGANIAEGLIPHEKLLGVAQETLDRAIAVNSLANLAAVDPMNATDLKLRMDYARLYSMSALVHLKQGHPAQADTAMMRARSYMHDGVNPQAVDLLRAALIDHVLARETQAWDSMQSALLLDSSIEQADPSYGPGLQALVEAREGHRVDLATYLSELRRAHAEVVPNLALLRHDGTRVTLSESRGKVLFINFFSPYCGTCRWELPAVKALADRYSEPGRVEFIFILNQPQSGEVATRFLAAVGLPNELVATLSEGSAYDYIRGEPTVWIVDDGGRLMAQHTGYREGEAMTYERELCTAISAAGGK